MNQFTVIGLGRFGYAASLELVRLGNSVLGIDTRDNLVRMAADHIHLATIADATDEHALKELGVQQSDAVLVAIGENLEASILCVLALKNLKAKQIWVKACSKAHHTILAKLGVDRIIHPEEEMGMRVAQSLNYPMVNQYMQLGTSQYVVEVDINTGSDGSTLGQLLRKTHGAISVLMIYRDKIVHAHPNNESVLRLGDRLVLSGALEALKKIAPRLKAS